MRKLALLLLPLLLEAFPASAAQPSCDAPDHVWRLPAAADRWPQVSDGAQASALRIVAVGSSSTQGTGASSAAATYPARLASMLQARLPHRRVEVLNKGIGGETVARNLARFERDVISQHPDLVLWQVGTNDALMGIDPKDVADGVRQGIAAIRAAGATPLLIEPQYLPRRPDDPAMAAMIDALREVAATDQVADQVTDQVAALLRVLQSGPLSAI